MKTIKNSTVVLVLALLVATPAYAGLESCRDPTPDERFQLDLCSAHAGCRLVVALMDGCTSVTNGIRRFFSSQPPQLDPGEYQTDRNAPLGPSELEQARKDNELHQRNQSLRESAASRAHSELVVLDRSIKARLERHCGNPLDQGCKDAVQDAESLVSKFNAYNGNPDHVELRGRLTAESPGIAASYGKLQAAAWEETNRKMEELNKSIRETQELKQKLLEAEKKKKEGDRADPSSSETAAKSPEGVDGIADLLQKGVNKVGDWFSKALSPEKKPSASEDEQRAARETSEWVNKNLAETQGRADKEQEERNRITREASARAERARAAEQAANQTPAERLANSYDQRITAVREQCAASDRNCNTGCMGVAAVGVLSLFIARGSAAGTASEQITQCTNRCTEAKSSCDQQVSALEQEKSQAISNSGRGPSPTASTSAAAPRANAGGKSCRDVLNSLSGPVNDGAASSRLTPAQVGPNSVWAMQTYLRVANTHPACANDAQSKQQVAAMLRQEQDRCRQSRSSNCDSGQNFIGTAARTEAAIQQLFQESSATGGAAANARPAGGDCRAAYDRQEAEFVPISQRMANTPSAVRQLQLLMGMLSKRMDLLNQLCRGQPQYAVYAETEQQFDSSMRTCRGVASNPGDCVPQ